MRDRFSDFDGGNRHAVLDGFVPHVFSLAVFEDWMYWTDWNHMAVEKANRFTGADRTILVNVTHRPMTVRVVHPLRQRQSTLCRRVTAVICVNALIIIIITIIVQHNSRFSRNASS